MSRESQRTYRRVVTTFWTDPDLRKRRLSRDEKHLLLYLFTNPRTNLSGLYWLPLTYAAQEAELELEDVRRWVSTTLTEYVTYDFETEEILVHKLAWHNVGEVLKKKDNRVKAIERALGDVHSRQLVEKWISTYPTWPIDRRKIPSLKDSEGASPRPSPEPLGKELPKELGEAKPHAVTHTHAVTSKGDIKHPPPSGNSEEADPDAAAREDAEDPDLEAAIAEHQPTARRNIVAIRGGIDGPVVIEGHEVGIGLDVARYQRICRASFEPPDIIAAAIAFLPEVTGLEPPITLARWEADDDGTSVLQQCVGLAYKTTPASVAATVKAPPNGDADRERTERQKREAREKLELLKRQEARAG